MEKKRQKDIINLRPGTNILAKVCPGRRDISGIGVAWFFHLSRIQKLSDVVRRGVKQGH